MNMFHLYDGDRIHSDGLLFPDGTVALKARNPNALVEVFESLGDVWDKYQLNRGECVPRWAVNGNCDHPE